MTLSQIHPVLDGKNRPLAEPTAFDINTSIQRCLVKAIALHGLGLYIYAGEDLPNGEEQPKPKPEVTRGQNQRLITRRSSVTSNGSSQKPSRPSST